MNSSFQMTPCCIVVGICLMWVGYIVHYEQSSALAVFIIMLY